MTTSPNKMSDEELRDHLHEFAITYDPLFKESRHHSIDAMFAIIKQHREAYAIEARIDELKRAKSLYFRTYKQEVTDNVGNVYANDSHGYISSYEVQERIAELKAQQEEV